jgi:diaminopimelate epimerase
MQFTKAHGCGNDFIIIDATRRSEGEQGELQPFSDREVIAWSARAPELCDRHKGVGADGLLLVGEGALEGGEHAPEMIVINADGSRSEMCGNGLRCVALWLLRRGLISEEGGAVITGAGALKVQFAASPHTHHEPHAPYDRTARSAWVGLTLGEPRALSLRDLSLKGEAEARCELTTLSLGNPHAVCFDQGAFEARAELASAWSAQFEGGVNLSFAQRRGERALELHVHERGCGWTLACGTGASATVIAAVERGLMPSGAPLEVTLPGGTLEVTYHKRSARPGDGWVELWGPAVEVFEGELTL